MNEFTWIESKATMALLDSSIRRFVRGRNYSFEARRTEADGRTTASISSTLNPACNHPPGSRLMRNLNTLFLCVALGAVLFPLSGVAQSARPLGQMVPVFSPVGDVKIRVAPPSETRVNVQAEPEGGFFARRRVQLRMLRAGSDGHLVVVDVGTSSVQVPGIQGLHELPLSDRGEFADMDGAASVLSLHPDRGDMVRVDLVVLIPEGHSVELHWAAGSVTVEGRSESWTSLGSPRKIRVTNDGRELKVDG